MDEHIRYSIEQIYFEISRAITSASFVKLYRGPGEPDDSEKEAGIKFGAAAISIVFAYATLEAFCNAHLHSKYKLLTPALKKNGWQLGLKNETYHKYFCNDESLGKLIHKDLREKLKVLAAVCNIRPIHESNPALWERLDDIVEEARHFVIHPKPDPEFFNEIMKKIMEKNKFGDYSSVVKEVLVYFYKESESRLPDWLEINQIFRFLSFGDLDKLSRAD